MKIAYIPQNDPYDKHSWSGTDYYTRLALENQGYEVYCIYGFIPRISFSQRLLQIQAKLLRKQYNPYRTKYASLQFANFIKERIQEDTDAIFSLGTIQVAMLNVNIPIYIYVDGIFEQMRVFYKWNKLTKRNIRESNEIEQFAINNCTKIISCSIETSKAINKLYNNTKNKVEVVPLGANWDKDPEEEIVFNSINKRCESSICNVLFVGVEWYRKGGDIVLNTIRLLHKKGFNVHLDICGIKKIPVELPGYVTNHGFLSKDDSKQRKELEELYLNSHFLFVPSRAEAYGLVFCEASAYGVPSISFREGGLTTTVIDGVNGQLFEINSKDEDFSDYILKTFNNKNVYRSLCYSSIDRYKQCLNWNVAGKSLDTIINKKEL